MSSQRVIVDPTTSLEVEVPDFATDQEALERHRRLLAGQIPEVEIYPEVGTTDVLWGIGIGPSSVREYGVTDALADEADAWQRWWSRGSDPQTGWFDPVEESAWLSEGERIWHLLHQKLWWHFDVVPAFRRLPERT